MYLKIMSDIGCVEEIETLYMFMNNIVFKQAYPAAEEKPPYPQRIIDTNALLRSAVAWIALNGPLVRAPSDPAPVVEGDLPVTEHT